MIGVKIREPLAITVLRHYNFNLKRSKTQTILACTALHCMVDFLFRMSPSAPHAVEIVIVVSRTVPYDRPLVATNQFFVWDKIGIVKGDVGLRASWKIADCVRIMEQQNSVCTRKIIHSSFVEVYTFSMDFSL